MSQISAAAPNKKQHLWKVSEQCKNNKNEASFSQSNFRLPERFSPSKSRIERSHIFNSSLEKQKLSKVSAEKGSQNSPRKYQQGETANLTQIGHRLVTSISQISPTKSSKQPKLSFVNRQSYTSITSEQLRIIRQESIKEYMATHDENRRLIMQLKGEFERFRQSVLEELKHQKEIIVKTIEEICKNAQLPDMADIKVSAYLSKQTKLEVHIDKRMEEIMKKEKIIEEKTKRKNDEILILDDKAEKKNSQAAGNIMPNFQSPKRNQNSSVGTPTTSPITNQAQNMQLKERANKQSPGMQKCNQIVETINILNEINDLPVVDSNVPNRPAQKIAIQEYKQKILAITKSNEQLLREKSKPKSKINDDQYRMKDNSKLDKFYSALQKLKEDVNEIKNIGKTKQLSKINE